MNRTLPALLLLAALTFACGDGHDDAMAEPTPTPEPTEAPDPTPTERALICFPDGVKNIAFYNPEDIGYIPYCCTGGDNIFEGGHVRFSHEGTYVTCP